MAMVREGLLALIVVGLVLTFTVYTASGALAVLGGGNGAPYKAPDPGTWAGGPQPNTVGLTLAATETFIPVIDGTAVATTPGNGSIPVFDLANPRNVVPDGIYTTVGPIARNAKIATWIAPPTSAVDYHESGMPTYRPYHEPVFGPHYSAWSEDGDNTYRVAVKLKQGIKVIKYNGATDTKISEFQINALGLPAVETARTMRCDTSCFAGKCNSKIVTRSRNLMLWGLVAHSNRAAVLIKVVDRAWFQLYDDAGVLKVNVDLNIFGYPLDPRFQGHKGVLKYGISAASGYQVPVYYAFFHATEGTCTHQGEELLLIDPSNWKAVSSAWPIYGSTAHPKEFTLAPLAWAGSHSFGRRLVTKVKTGGSISEQIVAIGYDDLPNKARNSSFSGKGGWQSFIPSITQVVTNYWMPNGYLNGSIGEWVAPLGSWNGNPTPYNIVLGGFSMQRCGAFPFNSSFACGITGWFAAFNSSNNGKTAGSDPLIYLKQMTPATDGTTNVLDVHLAPIKADRYLYAWTLRTLCGISCPSPKFQRFFQIIDGLGNIIKPAEEVTNLFAWYHGTEFTANGQGDILFANSWNTWGAGTNNVAGSPKQYLDSATSGTTFKVYTIHLRLGSMTGI